MANRQDGYGIFPIGNVIRSDNTFRDSNGDLADPTTVSLKFESPAGVITTYVFGTDAELTKVSTGVYRVDISASESGFYHLRWLSTGTGEASDKTSFKVRPGLPSE